MKEKVSSKHKGIVGGIKRVRKRMMIYDLSVSI